MIARSLVRTQQSSRLAQRPVYVPPFRRGDRTAGQTTLGTTEAEIMAYSRNVSITTINSVKAYTQDLQPRAESSTAASFARPSPRWPPVDITTGQTRLTPTAVAPTPATIAEAEAQGMERFGIADICPCNLDGHPCMLPLRCRYKKNIICTTHVSFLRPPLPSPPALSLALLFIHHIRAFSLFLHLFLIHP